MQLFTKERHYGWRVLRLLGIPFFAWHKRIVTTQVNRGGSDIRPLVISPLQGRGKQRDGLFALVMQFLGWMRYADRHGLVPVVDMVNCSNIYRSEGCKGTQNPWEAFFEQPAQLSVEEAGKAEKVRLTIGRLTGNAYPQQTTEVFSDEDGLLTAWRGIVAKYLRPRPEVRNRVEAFIEREHLQMARTIGVLARGTDYTVLRPKGHPIQPTMEKIVTDVQDLLSTRRYDRVFLVTEDEGNKRALSAAFGTRLVLAPQESIAYDGGYLGDLETVQANRDLAVNYLVSILILSKCGAIVAGRTSGSLGAALFSRGFHDQVFYDLGYYD